MRSRVSSNAKQEAVSHAPSPCGSLMEECKLTLLLLLLLLLPSARAALKCPESQHPSLSCYNDYNSSLTCEWNSNIALSAGTCQVLARSQGTPKPYEAFCILKPVDVSRSALRRCSMMFWKSCIFMESHVLSVSLNCTSVNMKYRPVCHIQLFPPQKPKINFTTVSWSPRGSEKDTTRFTGYISQMQWREEQPDQLWSPAHDMGAKWVFEKELDESQLIQGRRYEARVRVKPRNKEASWSAWSPVASWESSIGKSEPPSGFAERFLGMVIAGAVTFALVLAIVLLKTDKRTWADMAKKIQGPNPEKPFQTWLLKSPYFTRESFDSFLQPVEIVPVEVVQAVDGVEPFGPEVAPLLLEGVRGNNDGETSKSSFSNPSYSQLCPPTPPPPVATLTPGNLEPCAADTPYGPVGAHGEEDGGRSQEIQQLLSKGQNDGGGLQVVSDYEKVEQVGHARLQSLDSGVCSGEEISQESLEPDSIGEGAELAGSHLPGLFEKISGIGVVSRGSIQVVSDYERVEAVLPGSSELPSLDSGLSSAGEEQVSQEESLEESRFPFPSPVLLSTLLLSSPLPLSFLGQRSLEPSAEGYLRKKT